MKKTKMLKKNYEFKHVLSKGRGYFGKNISAFILDNGKKYNLLGLAISVKTAKAVRRNQIKRLIRENYYKQEEKILSGKSIVFVYNKKADIKKANYKNIKDDMEEIFNKAKIYENKECNEKNTNWPN